MSEQTHKSKTKDALVWVAVLLILVAGVWANEHFNYVDVSLRLIGWLLLVVVLVFVALQSQQGKALLEFARDARTELRRVVWPTRPETIQTTLVVIGAIILLGLIIWGIDTILLHLMGWLTGQRG